MKKMREDLKFQSYTLEAIADIVGFNNSQSFANAFQRKNGITPSYYRKQIEKERGD